MSTIKIKRSGTSSQTPSSLEHGELALNYADGKLFYKDASDNIAELSTGGAGGGTTYSIDETGRDNTGDWIQFASGVGNNQDRVFFKSRDTANTYRGTDAGFQFDGLTSNQAFVMEDGAKGVKFIGYHYETGADEGLEIEGKSGSGTKSTVYLKTNAKTAIKMTDGSVELPSIPTTDPINANEIWSDGGVLVMSGSTAPTGGAGGGLDSAGVQLLIDAEVQDPTTLTLGASSNAGIGIGSGVVTNGLSGGSVSIGTNANSYSQSVAIGSGADASGSGSVSVGPNTEASGNFNTAIGRQATTSGSNSLALGYSSSAGNFGIALGDAASGQRSIAVGALASAPATGALHINANYNSGVGPTADGGLVIETASARLEYSADSDWTFGAGVTMTDLTASGATVIFNNLPVIDPVNVGQLWNDNGTLKVSAG